jgi:phospholipid/cholesterol/gamma-HCH transport system permease protein
MTMLDIQQDGDEVQIQTGSHLNAETVGTRWPAITAKIDRLGPKTLTVDASSLEFIDGAGIAFFLTLQRHQNERQGQFAIHGLTADFQKLLDSSTLEGLATTKASKPAFVRISEEVGMAGYRIIGDLKIQISFLGESAYKLVTSLLNPAKIRWSDLFFLAEKAGADAIGIISLLGFLIGLILAFQSAVAMSMFGAEIYVADLVVLTMFKEMAPLISAFVLASRSGSAYAAEIGTMKVNEELDALHTFGMDPVRYLVVPRLIALVMVLPILTLFNNLFSMLGAQAVMGLLGYSSNIFWDRVTAAAGLTELFSGLVKTFVFGYFIAAIGCLRGINTGKGASAVGDSATSAVVTCIVMIVVVDGVFAVIYYSLGI